MIYIDIVLRLLTLLGRLLFIIVAAREMSVAEFGFLILITVSIGWLQYASAGIILLSHTEFFEDRFNIYEIVKTQVVVLCALSIVALVPLWVIFADIGISTFLILGLVLLIETTSNEISRHLVAIEKYTFANLVLFIKSGLWNLFFIGFVIIFDVTLNISQILYLWLASGLIACILGLVKLGIVNILRASISWVLLSIYIKNVSLILAGTLLMRAIYSFDKILSSKLHGVELTAVLGFYSSFGLAVVSILDASVTARAYPKIMQSLNTRRIKQFSHNDNVYSKNICIYTFISILYISFVDKFLELTQNQHYGDFTSIGVFYIIAYGFYRVYLFHLVIYQKSCDTLLVFIHTFSFVPL